MTAPVQAPKKVMKLEDFSPEARAAIQSRSVTGAWEPRKLVKLLGELSHFDEANEAAMKKAQNWMILFIVLAFAGFMVGIFLLASDTTAWGMLLPPVAVILAIRFGIKRSAHKKADLINDFRMCLRPALRDLAADLAPGEKIKVRMDLAGPVASKQTAKHDLPPGPYISLKETVYQDPWCEVRLPLIDGSTAIVEFEACWKKLERKYRGRRGKIKWKTKWRKECKASATMIPAQARQWNTDSLGARMDQQAEKFKWVEKEGLWAARMDRYWTFKGPSDPPADAPPAREVVGMLLRLHAAMGAPPEVKQ